MKNKIKKWIKLLVGSYLNRRQIHLKNAALTPEIWGLTYQNLKLGLRSTDFDELMKKFGSPLHVVMEERLLSNFRSFTEPRTSGGAFCDVFISYKTNPVPGVLQYLHQLGAGAEVISEYELWLALEMGVAPDRIIYNGPAKSDRSLEIAISQGIRAININHWEEVERIQAAAQRLGKQVAVGMRITGTGWAGQFGFSIDDGSALQALKSILKCPELKLISLHAHRGIAIRSSQDLAGHLNQVLGFCEQARQSTAWVPSILNVGGSLAIPTVRHLSEQEKRQGWRYNLCPLPPDPSATLSINSYSKQILAAVTERFQKWQHLLPQIVIEPGRSLTGNTQALLCEVMDIRKSKDFDYAILDAGSCHARIAADQFHQVFPLQKRAAPERCYRLVGPICHTGDVISLAYWCPTLERHDGLAIMDSGAYFIADSASFSFPRAGVVSIDSQGSARLLRKIESFESMKNSETEN